MRLPTRVNCIVFAPFARPEAVWFVQYWTVPTAGGAIEFILPNISCAGGWLLARISTVILIVGRVVHMVPPVTYGPVTALTLAPPATVSCKLYLALASMFGKQPIPSKPNSKNIGSTNFVFMPPAPAIGGW